MSLVILEGPDCGGKTTLAKRIMDTQQTECSIVHHGAYLGEERVTRYYLASVMQAVMNPSKLVVMDRSWLSEPIYGDVMRDGMNRISNADRVALESAAAIAHAVVVLCLPPLDACLAAWRARIGDEYVKREGAFRQVWHGYFRAAEQWRPRLTVVMYDYTRDPEAEMTKSILEILI